MNYPDLSDQFTYNFPVSWILRLQNNKLSIFWPNFGTFLIISRKLIMLEVWKQFLLKVYFMNFSMIYILQK